MNKCYEYSLPYGSSYPTKYFLPDTFHLPELYTRKLTQPTIELYIKQQ